MKSDQRDRVRIVKGENEKGFTLLEVIFAVSILSFGLLAVATMQASSISGNSLASDVTEATAWGSDTVETLMRLSAINYNDPAALLDLTGDGDGGLNDTGANADYSVNQGRYTISWNVSVNSAMTNTKTVNVIVTWAKKGVTKRVEMVHVIPRL